jgi:hypothetical protein
LNAIRRANPARARDRPQQRYMSVSTHHGFFFFQKSSFDLTFTYGLYQFD